MPEQTNRPAFRIRCWTRIHPFNIIFVCANTTVHRLIVGFHTDIIILTKVHRVCIKEQYILRSDHAGQGHYACKPYHIGRHVVFLCVCVPFEEIRSASVYVTIVCWSHKDRRKKSTRCFRRKVVRLHVGSSAVPLRERTPDKYHAL